jgi:RND superfamily putative drug exporter
MGVFGEVAWWLPRWLDRLLPNLDVEGERLINHPSGDATRPGSFRPVLDPTD